MGFDKLRQWVVERVLLNFVVGWVVKRLDKWLAKLPENDRKTITGFMLAALGLLIQELPASSQYLDPIIQLLQSLPHETMVVGGVLWSAVGLFHKAIKWVKAKFENLPANTESA